MRYFSTSRLFCSALLIFCFQACDDADNVTNPNQPNLTTKEFAIWGNYTNMTRNNPEFVFNPDSSDLGTISFGSIQTAIQQGQVMIQIRNLSLSDSIGNYIIPSNDAIVVEERRENRVWISDAEFTHSYEALTTIAVVLVLDVSGSLGDDFTSVKAYAKEFLQIVSDNISSARIGVVVFSSDIQTLALTDDISRVQQFIDDIQQGQNSTKLYDAMAQGIGMLQNQIVDGRALMSFTDGADNFSNTTSGKVIETLTDSDIKSFTIGLRGKGNLDSVILDSLAVNGVSRVAESINVLQPLFQQFSREITNVYNVTYIRNDQQIQQPLPIRFVINGSVTLDN